jgi:uncharacterized membrane protein
MESASSPKPDRLFAPDALRGLILILMAVDHASYFLSGLHPTGEFWGIPIPQYTDIAEFLTRFVTHLCAPGFFFLMGVGMVLFAQSRRSLGWPEEKISRHLLVRGFILIFCQFFFENTAWVMGPVTTFKPPGTSGPVWIHFGVLAALGFTMVFGTLFLRSKPALLIGISTLILVGTQFLVPDPSLASQPYSPLIRILIIPGRTGIFQSFYPIIPWLGIVLLGLVFGKWLAKNRKEAYSRGLVSGSVFLILFLVIRMVGKFGNIHPPAETGLIPFLNVTKYPPSLAFTLLNIGLCLLILWLISRIRSKSMRSKNPFLVFGQSSLFFYILHLYLFAIFGLFFKSRGGTGLVVMYLIWILVLCLLYPLCLKYREFKKKTPEHSFWRFF